MNISTLVALAGDFVDGSAMNLGILKALQQTHQRLPMAGLEPVPKGFLAVTFKRGQTVRRAGGLRAVASLQLFIILAA
ncbi:MAG: hypothetical protein AAFO87_08380 [Cyanobacteria bacterium J06607_6]